MNHLLDILPDMIRRPIFGGGDENSQDEQGHHTRARDDENDRRSKIASLHVQMSNAVNFQEWCQAAVKLDVLEDRELWKVKAESPFYDHSLVQAHIDGLKEARKDSDMIALSHHLRNSMHRNFGGLENPRLYEHTHVGTKYLVEDYVHQVTQSIDKLINTQVEVFPVSEKLAFFKEIRRLYGNSALLLSGGSVFGLYHLGVVKALAEAGLIPRVISGSSAGSLVAALVGIKCDEEILASINSTEVQRLDLFGSAESLLSKFRRVITEGVVADITHLQQSCRECVGDITFEEAYENTGRVLSITVTLIREGTPCTRLLNHLTSPHVVIWSAAIASCAAPGIFRPVEIFRKQSDGQLIPFDPTSRQYLDGSYVNDLPMDELSELFGVNYFIVSQVNPYVIPFIKGLQKRPPKEIPRAGALSRFSTLCQDFLKSEIHHRCVQMAELGLAPRMLEFLVPVINQTYSGDVTIVPEFRNCLKTYVTLLSNPTQECIEACIQDGLKSTWPALSMIKNHCQIESCIRNGVEQLRRDFYQSKGPQSLAPTIPVSELFANHSEFKSLSRLNENFPLLPEGISGVENMHTQEASVIVSARCRIGLLADVAFTMAKLGLAVVDGSLTTCGQWSFTRFHVRLSVPLGREKSVSSHLRLRLETLLFDEEATVLVKLVPFSEPLEKDAEMPPGSSRITNDANLFAPGSEEGMRRIKSCNDIVRSTLLHGQSSHDCM